MVESMEKRSFLKFSLLILGLIALVGLTGWYAYYKVVVCQKTDVGGKPIDRLGQEDIQIKRVDRIVINKSAREMIVYLNGQKLKKYKISLGFNPVGHKLEEGDGKTPQGVYSIALKNPTNRYHLSLKVSYPNELDKLQAKQRGVSPGGDIMIHGLPNGMGWLGQLHLAKDWTAGCIAVSNGAIEELYNAVGVGTPVEINP